jgi:hypothetical protein
MTARFTVSMRVGDHWENYSETNYLDEANDARAWLHRCFPGREVVIRVNRPATIDRAA